MTRMSLTWNYGVQQLHTPWRLPAETKAPHWLYSLV